MISFFNALVVVENQVLGESSYINCSGDRVPYSDQTVETVEALIAFVESGKFTKAKCSKFIGKHFRYSTEALTKQWNREFGANKSPNTMRSQISVTSTALYGLFGNNFAEELITDNPANVISVLTCLEIGNVMFDDIFIYEVSDAVDRGYDKESYEISELSKEISVLQNYRLKKLEKGLEGLNKSKLAYIKRILDKPLVVDHAVNQHKLELLKAFQQLPKKNIDEPTSTSSTIRKPQETIASSEIIDCIVSSVDSGRETVNMTNVDQLVGMMYALYTEDGINRYFGKFTKKEVLCALQKIKSGR